MKMLTFAIAAFVTAATFAEEATTNKVVRRKRDRAKMEEMWKQRTGGRIMVPNSQKGKIVFVNAQTQAQDAWITEVARYFASGHKLVIEVEKGEFAMPSPKIVGNASLYIIDDPKMPSILHAPENRWTMINVAPLREGEGAKPQFFEARFKKELVRGFCLLAGTQTSNYPNSLLTAMTKPSDLDTRVDARLPVDIPARFVPYLAGFGITPAVYSTYIKACQEGWAPAPTNDYQKAIWDKVHELPSEPITIEKK